MTLKLSEIAVDPTLAKEGVWATIMGGKFKLCRPGQAHRSEIVKLYQENHEALKKADEKSDLLAADLFLRAFCTHCLVDWDEIEGMDGKPQPYSVEAAMALMSNPQLEELREQIETFVAIRSNFQAKVEDEVIKGAKRIAVS